jgi:hypothetical protein
MKLLIIPQFLSLCLMGYVWFGQASSRSLLKWSVGGLAGRLSLHVAVEIHLALEPPASQSWQSSWLVVVLVPLRRCLCLLLPPLTPS